MLLILLCASAFSAQKKAAKKRLSGERLITALINSKTLPGNFGDSGVFLSEQGLTADYRPMSFGF